MNAPEKPTPPRPSASEYILDNFKPTDRIAVLVLNRQLGETTQRITTAQKASSPEFQAYLRYKNANGADIYRSQESVSCTLQKCWKDVYTLGCTIVPEYKHSGPN